MPGVRPAWEVDPADHVAGRPEDEDHRCPCWAQAIKPWRVGPDLVANDIGAGPGNAGHAVGAQHHDSGLDVARDHVTRADGIAHASGRGSSDSVRRVCVVHEYAVAQVVDLSLAVETDTDEVIRHRVLSWRCCRRSSRHWRSCPRSHYPAADPCRQSGCSTR